MASVGAEASSAMESATSAASQATGMTLAESCTEIDTIMTGTPDSDPAATAAALEKIAATMSASESEGVTALAKAYTAMAADPASTANQETLKQAASSLGAACQSATQSAQPSQ